MRVRKRWLFPENVNSKWAGAWTSEPYVNKGGVDGRHVADEVHPKSRPKSGVADCSWTPSRTDFSEEERDADGIVIVHAIVDTHYKYLR